MVAALGAHLAETLTLLAADPDAAEILVERVKPLRFAEVNAAFDATFARLNGAMTDAH